MESLLSPSAKSRWYIRPPALFIMINAKTTLWQIVSYARVASWYVTYILKVVAADRIPCETDSVEIESFNSVADEQQE